MTTPGTFDGVTDDDTAADEPGGLLAERLAGVAALLSGDAPEEAAEEVVEEITEAVVETVVAVVEAPEVDDPVPDLDETPAEPVAEVVVEETAPESVEEVAAEEAAPKKAAAKKAAPKGAATEEAVTAEGADEDAEAEEEEEVLPPASPYDLPGSWYVVHSYSGYENKVKANLGTRIKSMHMEDSIFDINIPMEDVVEIKSGRKVTVPRKQFPGYILVRMYMDDDSWGVVRNTPGVTGFVGSGTKPTPLSRREVERILGVRKDEEKKAPRFKPDWEVGETVRVIDGPFADFNGVIEDINVDQSKVRVLVDIFGRETPVELNFEQIQKF